MPGGGFMVPRIDRLQGGTRRAWLTQTDSSYLLILVVS